jgi:D-alanyl-D-alanine dipeptidase
MKFQYFLILFLFIACKKEVVNSIPIKKNILIDDKNSDLDSIPNTTTTYIKNELLRFKDSTFVDLKKIDTSFVYDMKYATIDNFLKEKVYDCNNCLVRYKTARYLIKANDSLKKLGYKIKFFDCYRPLTIQKKMWKIYPDARYVANPKKGSNHNRGSAVDITLVNINNGKDLEMGTPFDFFGNKAHHAYSYLPKTVLENRKLLKSVMESNGFKSITSEWWHYNLINSPRFKVSDFKTQCD